MGQACLHAHIQAHQHAIAFPAPRRRSPPALAPTPSPPDLAHLAAFRGRLMMDIPDSGSESSRGSGGSKPRPLLSISNDFSDKCMFYI